MAESPDFHGIQVNGRLWMERNGEIFLSRVRRVLPEHIREAGAITVAYGFRK